jgi:hypothetical protein
MAKKKPGRTVDEGKPGAGKPVMTLDQFHVVVQLLKGKLGTPANDAACLVLVEGLTKPVAAAMTGATRSTVHDAVTRFYEAFLLIGRAWPSPVSITMQMLSYNASGRSWPQIQPSYCQKSGDKT